MWLKVHYPMEFYSSILSLSNSDDKKKKIVKEYLREGFKLLPIDINRSKEQFAIDEEGIRIGFENIKGIGESKSKRIVKYQPYISFSDFEKKNQKLNKTTSKNLVNLGAFDFLGNNTVQKTLFGESIREYKKDELQFAERFFLCPWDLDFGIEKKWKPFIQKHIDYFKKEPIKIEELKEKEGSEDVLIYGIAYDKNLRDAREVSMSKGKGYDVNKYKIVHLFNKELIKKYGGAEFISQWTFKDDRKKYRKDIDYKIENQFQFANFVLEDDTDFITVRISHIAFPLYGKLIFEGIKAEDPILIKGKMGSGIRMFFANKIISLPQLKNKLENEK